VLASFSHYQGGARFAIQLLHGMLFGYYAFAAFCLTLHLALSRLSMSTAFTVAFITALLVQLTTRRVLQRRAELQQPQSRTSAPG
jgi:hypothetical protein